VLLADLAHDAVEAHAVARAAGLHLCPGPIFSAAAEGQTLPQRVAVRLRVLDVLQQALEVTGMYVVRRREFATACGVRVASASRAAV
jgi:hypothetical protein